MAIEAIEEVKKNIKSIEPRLKDVKTMIAVLKQAGESTTEVENQLRELERKKTKWENAIRNAGY
ncbi:MAG: hypothetical protein PVG39_27220 [Desulfobacteraceae bacterium]|jgi:hypothetical protein